VHDRGEANGRKSTDGKTGLGVLMMIIEKSLSTEIDETQRILAGPLIAELLQKVGRLKRVLNVGEWRDSGPFTVFVECYYNATCHGHEPGIYSGSSLLCVLTIVANLRLRDTFRVESAGGDYLVL
jgi:hypothetical protein